jgi:hypothetical protein
MRASKSCWLMMGMLGLVLWPAVISAQGDWRIGQAQEQLKAAGFNPGPNAKGAPGALASALRVAGPGPLPVITTDSSITILSSRLVDPLL